MPRRDPDQPKRRGVHRVREYGRFDVEIDERRLSLRTQPGVFSKDAPDDGSMLLIETVLPRIKPHMYVLDLGCGIGLIGIAVAARAGRGEVWMTDVDVRAVRLAEHNIEANHVENAHVQLGDITLDLPGGIKFDAVLSNPPTHSGKEVLQSFVGESYDLLRPGGSLYVVVNRLLSIRDMMQETFGNVEQIERRKGFLILASEKPRRAGRDQLGE